MAAADSVAPAAVSAAGTRTGAFDGFSAGGRGELRQVDAVHFVIVVASRTASA